MPRERRSTADPEVVCVTSEQRASGARRRDQPGRAAQRVHRLRAVHASRHLAGVGARRRRLPQAAPHARRGCRRRRGCTQLRAVVPRMSRGRRSPAEEPPPRHDGFVLRRVGGVGERRGGTASRQQRRGPDRPARLAPRERPGEHDRVRVGRVGCPTHGPGDDHDEGGCARCCGFALRARGRPRESRRGGGAKRSPPSRARSRRSGRSGHPLDAGCRGAHPPLVLLRRHPLAARDRRTPGHARSGGRRSPRRSLVPRSGLARSIHRSRCGRRCVDELRGVVGRRPRPVDALALQGVRGRRRRVGRRRRGRLLEGRRARLPGVHRGRRVERAHRPHRAGTRSRPRRRGRMA